MAFLPKRATHRFYCARSGHTEGMPAHVLIGQDRLNDLLARYPALGALKRVVRDGLSVNAPACLFETATGTYFAKRLDLSARGLRAIEDEHRLVGHLVESGYPTPRLHANEALETLTPLHEACYAIYDRAAGEDRYGEAAVFAPFGHPAEAEDAGRRLAQFHLALAELRLAPRVGGGLRARFGLVAHPHAEGAFQEAAATSPPFAAWLAQRPERLEVAERLEARRIALAPLAARWPNGVLHGDFIKRNLFWDGPRVASVIDMDLWDQGPWVFDLALALLPCGFEWPRVLAGSAQPSAVMLQAMRAGYESERALDPAEWEGLPLVMEAARGEFYLQAAAVALAAGDAARAQGFWELLVNTLRYFDAHPRWRLALGG